MAIDVTSPIARAFQRANANGLSARVEFKSRVGVEVARYSVPSVSTAGAFHTVEVEGDAYRCTCRAAVEGLEACQHRAAVAQYRASRRAQLGQADGPRHAVRGDAPYDPEAARARVAYISALFAS